MDLTYTSPIRYDFVPISGSEIEFEFKLKVSKSRIKINIDVNIFYINPFIIGRVHLISSGSQNVYTSTVDEIHKLKFKIPEFKNCTKSYINITMEPSGDIYGKVIIEDMRVVTDSKISKTAPSIVPSIISDIQRHQTVIDQHIMSSSISNIEEIKKFVIEGYRKILLREPDQNGFDHYIGEISSGKISRERFLDILKGSEEYIIKLKDTPKISIDTLESFDRLVTTNKKLGRPWYFGLEGTWWWGISEENIRNKIIEIENKIIEIEKSLKIAIVSIVRNEEHNNTLGRFLDCCRELEQYHKNIIYIFIEGDSSDKTYDVLKSWVDNRSGSVLKKVNRGHPPFPKTRNMVRTAYFAELRNMLIDIVLSRLEIKEILMIDASYGWRGDLISSLREINVDIAAPLVVQHKDSNGNYLFYDIWAFRKNGREFGPFYPYIEDMRSGNPVDIDSAGGGYLIKRHVLDAGVRYNGNNDCEHISFCRDAKKKGFTIKINPKTYIRKGGFKE